jgi:hypothetical protein
MKSVPQVDGVKMHRMTKDLKSERQYDQLVESLEISPSTLPADQLLPIFVPASFFELDNWPGPYHLCKASGLGQTWVILQSEETMLYLSRTVQEYWESKGVEWAQLAKENLVRMSEENQYTHEFRRDNGQLYAVALMQDDGLGPSRLLLGDYFNWLFPQGYNVALPEMSCGFVIAKDITKEEGEKFAKIVDDCYHNGTRPLIPGFHDATDI